MRISLPDIKAMRADVGFTFPGQGTSPMNFGPILVAADTIIEMEATTHAETPTWASPEVSVADTSTTKGVEGVGTAADRESGDEDESEPDDAEDG